MNEEQFWMVWSPQGSVPTHQHITHSSALSEAERLARKCPGKEFYVLQATDLRIVNDMQRVRLHPGQVPF